MFLSILSHDLGEQNIEFSCRPESTDHAPVQRAASFLAGLHPGGQLQRFVISTIDDLIMPVKENLQKGSHHRASRLPLVDPTSR